MSRTFLRSEALDFIESCLQQSQQQTLAVLNSNFIIKAHNIGFSKLLGAGEDLSGRELQSFLLPESRAILDPSIVDRAMPVRLNFNTPDKGCLSLNCRLSQVGEDYFLFGFSSSQADNDILRTMTTLNNEMATLTRELNRKNRALEEARAKIKVLSGILPICMYCKGIRDDKGYWNKVESYITENSEAQFSHGICEKCLKEQYGEKLAGKYREGMKKKESE